MSGTFRTTITAQLRHGVLWEARRKVGTAKALAELLGFNRRLIDNWLNLKEVPSKPWLSKHWTTIEIRLSELLGRAILVEELFPDELRSEAFKSRPKRAEVTDDVPLDLLISAGAFPALPPGPEEAFRSAEMGASLRRVLKTLTPRQEQVLSAAYGLDGSEPKTLADIAREAGVQQERIRQIEAGALRKLRHPARAKHLRSYV